MLAVAVVLFLAVGVSEGVVLNKCSLKQQLQANLTLPSNAPNMLAQIVCQVQMTSNFNTSAVKNITEVEEIKKARGSHKAWSVKIHGKSKTHPSAKEETIEELWTMYGIFQLSDHVACNSTHSSTLNVCGLSCSKLTDTNLTDDIACLQVLVNKMTEVTNPENFDEIVEMALILQHPECLTKRNSGYFSDC